MSAAEMRFSIDTDFAVGPRVLYTWPDANAGQQALWTEEIEAAAATLGYSVDWDSQVATAPGRFAAPLV